MVGPTRLLAALLLLAAAGRAQEEATAPVGTWLAEHMAQVRELLGTPRPVDINLLP
jgi:hypothetical protein